MNKEHNRCVNKGGIYTALMRKNNKNNDNTPFFPAWRPRLGPMHTKIAASFKKAACYTLKELEDHFASFLPPSLFPKAANKTNSRDRIYTQALTFWTFIWQSFNPGSSCRQAVRQVQALFALLGRQRPSSEDGAYCIARNRLPIGSLEKALNASVRAAESSVGKTKFLQGRPTRAVDGTFLTLPDSKSNRKKYPKFKNGKTNTGFPQMRLVVLFCLASGAIVARLTGNKHSSESGLFRRLMKLLSSGDIIIGDRGFGTYILIALLQALGVDFIGRPNRKINFKKAKGPCDEFIVWNRSATASAIVSARQWKKIPTQLKLRVIRARVTEKGFRVSQIVVVTTLLDQDKYPASEILQAYLRRWRLEMCLDDLKTTLGMASLQCKTPKMIQKELLIHLIAHNLIRWTMAEASRLHDVDIERISFKGTRDAYRQFGEACAQARSVKRRREVWSAFLEVLSEDLVPERPGRREPRARKRQNNKYPRLTVPRKQFKDRPKRNKRRSAAIRRRRS